MAFDSLIESTADLVHPEVRRLAREEYLNERTAWLTQEAAALANRGLAVELEVVWAPAGDRAILAHLSEASPDLVIKDVTPQAPERSGSAPAPDDWKLLRACPVPLMMVRPQSPALPARVAAAVDTRADTDEQERLNGRVVDQALTLGLFSDAEVHVAHVFPYREDQKRPYYRALEDAYARLQREDARRFAAFCDARKVPDDRRHLLRGGPASALTKWAHDASADLIVCGNAHRNAVERFFLGSTAENLVNRIDADVVVVKADDFVQHLRSACGGVS